MGKKFTDYKMGDCVKVRKGVLDPDNNEYSIEGWQGRIIWESTSEQDEPIFLIKWDSLTLKNMDESFIIESTQENFEFAEMYLGINDVQYAKCRDKEQESDQVAKEIYKKYVSLQSELREFNNDEIDEQEQRIAAILNGINKGDEAEEERWEEYLNNNLEFPFEAVIADRNEDTEILDNGDIVSVKKIEGIFDLYGIIVEIRKGRKKYHIPLCELEVSDKSSPNDIKVDDYNFWFANR